MISLHLPLPITLTTYGNNALTAYGHLALTTNGYITLPTYGNNVLATYRAFAVTTFGLPGTNSALTTEITLPDTTHVGKTCY